MWGFRAAKGRAVDSPSSREIAAGTIVEPDWSQSETREPSKPLGGSSANECCGRPDATRLTQERGARSVSLRRNFLWMLTANGVDSIGRWLVIIALAKLGSKEMVGVYALGYVLTLPIFEFANLHLRAVLSTDALGEYDPSDYLGLRFLTTAGAALTVGVILGISGYGSLTCAVVILMTASKCAEAFSDALYGFQQRHERIDQIARSTIIRSVLALCGMLAGLFLTHSMIGVMAGLALAFGAVLIWVDWPSANRTRSGILKASVGAAGISRFGCPALSSEGSLDRTSIVPRWRWPRLWSLTLRALPLGAVMMLVTLHTSVPRYLLERTHGLASLGILAAIGQLAEIGTRAINAMSLTASPRLANYFAAGDRSGFRRLIVRMVALAAGVGVLQFAAGAALGTIGLRCLLTPEYAEHANVLMILLLAAGIRFVNASFGVACTAMRQFREQLLPNVIAAMLMAASGALLIPRFGIKGAAWTIVASALSMMGATLVVLVRVRWPPREDPNARAHASRLSGDNEPLTAQPGDCQREVR